MGCEHCCVCGWQRGKGALCSAVLCSARLCSVLDAGDGRSPRCWKSERSLLSLACRRWTRPLPKIKRWLASITLWFWQPNFSVEFFFFYATAGCIHTYMCNKTDCCFLMFTCFVGNYWIDSGFSGNARGIFFFSGFLSLCLSPVYRMPSDVNCDIVSKRWVRGGQLWSRHTLMWIPFPLHWKGGTILSKGMCLISLKPIITTKREDSSILRSLVNLLSG